MFPSFVVGRIGGLPSVVSSSVPLLGLGPTRFLQQRLFCVALCARDGFFDEPGFLKYGEDDILVLSYAAVFVIDGSVHLWGHLRLDYGAKPGLKCSCMRTASAKESGVWVTRERTV